MFAVGLPEKFNVDGAPTLPFFANNRLGDAMLLMGVAFPGWSIGIVLTTLTRRPELQRDQQALGSLTSRCRCRTVSFGYLRGNVI